MPTDFQFAKPQLAVLFLGAAAIVILYWILWRSRHKVLDVFGSSYLLHEAALPRSAMFQRMKVGFLCTSWVFAVFALMGPEGNAHYVSQKAYKMGAGEIVFLVDVSDSMSVNDTRTGISRLGNAKQIIENMIPEIRGRNASLFAFTSDLIPLAPGTIDTLFIRLMLDRLKINEGGLPGTDFVKSLSQLKDQLESQRAQKAKTVILLSDGGDTLWESLGGAEKEERKKKIAHAAKELNASVITVGMGSEEPVRISGLQYEGKPVMTRLQPELLRKIGKYYNANRAASLTLAKNLASEEVSEKEVSLQKVVYDLYFQIPLFLSILFFAAALLIPETEKRKTA